MKLLSFIVTVYNQEEYIDECLHSLLPLSDIADIIVVDDGSYDNSLQLVKQIQKSKSNIHVLQQTNKGVSIARNNALKLVHTPYVSFVDGDDCIEFADKKTVRTLINVLNEGWDMIQYSMLFNWGGNNEQLKSSSQEIYGAKKYLEACITGDLTYSCCNKIFRKELFDSNLFPEKRRYEDVCLLISLADIIRRVKIIPDGRYLYRYNAISFSFKKVTFEKVHDFIQMSECWKSQIVKHSISKYWRTRLKVYMLIELARFQTDISVLHFLPSFSLCRKECIVSLVKPLPYRTRLFLLINFFLGSVNSVLLFSYIYKLKRR